MLSHPRLHCLVLALLLHLGWLGWLSRALPPEALPLIRPSLALAGAPAIRLLAAPAPSGMASPPAPAAKPAPVPKRLTTRPVRKPQPPVRRSRPRTQPATPLPSRAVPAKSAAPASVAATAVTPASAPSVSRAMPAAPGGELVQPRFRVPPRPPVYPTPARRRGQEGTVWLEVELDGQGRQQAQHIVTSSGVPVLDAAALKAVRQWQFNPHIRDGRPQPSRVRIPVQFQLK